MIDVLIKESSLEGLPFKALMFLMRAYDQSRQEKSFKDLVSNGTIYTISSGEEIVGAIYLEKLGNVLTIVLFSCDRISDIKDHFSAFAQDLLHLNNCDSIFVVGRAGWNRIFPDFECLGTVYKMTPQGG